MQLWEFIKWQAYCTIAGNPSRIASRMRSKLNKTTCRLDAHVHIENASRFYAERGSAIYFGTHILNHRGDFSIGVDSHLGAYCHANVCEGTIRIGDNVAIGPHCSIIAYSNHYAPGKIVTSLRINEEVAIGNNVFIGAGTTILPGSTIGDNVVVGAGSLVKGNLEADAIYVGSPCRILRKGWFSSASAHENEHKADA